MLTTMHAMTLNGPAFSQIWANKCEGVQIQTVCAIKTFPMFEEKAELHEQKQWFFQILINDLDKKLNMLP